jgi:hypothetical protein
MGDVECCFRIEEQKSAVAIATAVVTLSRRRRASGAGILRMWMKVAKV